MIYEQGSIHVMIRYVHWENLSECNCYGIDHGWLSIIG